jgi:hypothetical protein
VPRHVTRLVTRLIAPLVVDFSASCRLVVDYFASRRLVVDYFASAARPGASARHAARLGQLRLAGSLSTTSPPPCVRVPQHIARLITRLVAPLVVDFSASRSLIVDYSSSCRLVVDYFTSSARPGASARRVARNAARHAARRRLLHLA